MRFIRTLCCLAFLVAAFPAFAAAQDSGPDWANKKGAFGMGYTGTLGGQNGINFRYFVTPQFGLELVLDFGLEIEDPDMADTENVITFGSSFYLVYKLAYWQRGGLGLIGGVDFDIVSDSRQDDIATNVALGLGLQGEWFPTQYLSLFAQAGFRLQFLGDDDAGIAPGAGGGDISGVAFDLGADLFGQFGFTVWFQ